jgi:acyl-CoA hydrolase
MTTSSEEAVKKVKSGDNIFIHSAAAAPQKLINSLVERADELKDVNIYQLHTEGQAPYATEKFTDSFKLKLLFVGSNTRGAVQHGRGSYIPIFLSEIPSLFRRRVIPLDVALIMVSSPDRHGFCSLGTSVDVSLAAEESAKLVIAQINKYMPRSHGDGLIHTDNIDIMVEHNEPLPDVKAGKLSDSEIAIGKNIAELVEDGATLQMGIGAIPNAVLSALYDHKDLGIHSEMFSDGVLPLVEKGIITGKRKTNHHGLVVASFVIGSKKLYDFVDDNPLVNLLDSSYVNNTTIIRQNPKVTAINSAIEIDLTGQVCADSIGSKIYSGVGGQMDFMRGASLSEGGKPIIALTSTTKNGVSKLVPVLKNGAGVVTTRAHMHWVVTEFGAVNLYGKTIQERANLLIKIAHPDHREVLSREAHEIWR